MESDLKLRKRGTVMSKASKAFSGSSERKKTFQKVKVDQISKHTWFEELNYKLNVLVPINEETELLVPMDSYLQQVHNGPTQRWRVKKDMNYNLPSYLTDYKEEEKIYKVIQEQKKIFGPLTLGSTFLKRWDALALTLLLFTASVTPFETAFITEDVQWDLLYLANRFVDAVFFIDIFIQMRTPYKDAHTGKLILDVKVISMKYITSWFPMDLISVLPFEFIGPLLSQGEDNTHDLKLLRFFRLTRLLKLLRVFRASRKLRQITIASGLRYSTLEIAKIVCIAAFSIHWLACGYRLAAEYTPGEAPGWVEHFREYKNLTTLPVFDCYSAAVYWASGTVSMIGVQGSYLAPTQDRELLFAAITHLICYLAVLYFIATLTSALHTAGELKRRESILLDNYLEMFDNLRLDTRLKYTVAQHLVDHFASLANKKQTEMLQNLPKSLHCFISMEIYLDFVLRIPFFEAFVDHQPVLIQDLCQGIEKRNVPVNNLLFEEGFDGIYLIDEGVVAMEGWVYPSGSIIGLTCLRDQIKKSECRALTDVKCCVIPKPFLLELLARFPKVRYYCKRWTAWQVLRDYILAYSSLYYTAARRGALMSPPLLSRRPDMEEDEDDDIDIAVLDHLAEIGF